MEELTPHEDEVLAQYDELIRLIRSNNPENWKRMRALLNSLDRTSQGKILTDRIRLLEKQNPALAQQETERLLRAIFDDAEKFREEES